MKTLLALLLLVPSLSWGNHNMIEFDRWKIHNSQLLWVMVYNKTKYDLNASRFSFEVNFEDGSSRIYNTENDSWCPARNECTWYIRFTQPNKPKTFRLIHE